MGATYGAGQTSTAHYSTDIDVDLPTHSDGDLLIMFVSVGEAHDGTPPGNEYEPTVPSGWTEAAATSDGVHFAKVLWKIASSEPSSVNLDNGNSYGTWNAFCFSVEDTDAHGPTPFADIDSATGTEYAPAVTIADDDSLVFRMWASEVTSATTLGSFVGQTWRKAALGNVYGNGMVVSEYQEASSGTSAAATLNPNPSGNTLDILFSVSVQNYIAPENGTFETATDGVGAPENGAFETASAVGAPENGAFETASDVGALENGAFETASAVGAPENGAFETASDVGALENGAFETASDVGVEAPENGAFETAADEVEIVIDSGAFETATDGVEAPENGAFETAADEVEIVIDSGAFETAADAVGTGELESVVFELAAGIVETIESGVFETAAADVETIESGVLELATDVTDIDSGVFETAADEMADLDEHTFAFLMCGDRVFSDEFLGVQLTIETVEKSTLDALTMEY